MEKKQEFKSYQKKVEVEAMPCTKGEAYKAQVVLFCDDNEKDIPGFMYKDQDGRVVWTEAEVFNSEYRCIDSFKDRMQVELDELVEKGRKLDDFLLNKAKDLDISEVDMFLMRAQAELMYGYSRILSKRNNPKDSQLFAMPFCVAVQAIKGGMPCYRLKDRNSIIIKQVAQQIGADVVPKMSSLPPEFKHGVMGSVGRITYHDQCLVYDMRLGLATSWNPTVEDILANDWCVADRDEMKKIHEKVFYKEFYQGCMCISEENNSANSAENK